MGTKRRIISAKSAHNLLSKKHIHQGSIVGSTGKVITGSNRCYWDYIHVNSGDKLWFFSKTSDPAVYGTGFFYTAEDENTFVRQMTGTAFTFSGYTGYCFTATADGYIRGLWLQSDNFTPYDIDNPAIYIQSTQPTHYEPYLVNRIIAQQVDGFIKRDEYYPCGCKVMTGTETINTYGTNKIWFDVTARKSGGGGASNYYKNQASSGMTENGVWFSTASYSIIVRDDEHASSPTDYKAFLASRYAAGNPVIFYYQRPTDDTFGVKDITYISQIDRIIKEVTT